MSFSFSFSGDDIEDDTTSETNEQINHATASTQDDALSSRLQKTNLTATLIPPKHHTLADLLTGLPSQISYNYLEIPPGQSLRQRQQDPTTANDHDSVNAEQIRIPRRSLFDIRQQLMAESDPGNLDDETGSLLSGLETGDLSSGIYEGGFKTWECAVDLARFVSGGLDGDMGSVHVVELGAGSAVPALVMLGEVFRLRHVQRQEDMTKRWGKVRFTLCDYNVDVLRLGTAMNVFLLLTLAVREELMAAEEQDEGDIEVDEGDVQRVLKMLKDVDIQVDFISGAWGGDFVKLVRGNNELKEDRLLLLASETIYSPDSLRVFSETVLDILKLAPDDRKAYIAAKKVYFGVGGGVQEFEEETHKLGGTVEQVLDVKSAGVGRVVLEVSTG